MIILIKELQKNKSICSLRIISTGQHKELLKPLEIYYNVKPDFDLNIMSNKQSLASLLIRIQQEILSVYQSIKPKLIFVQGDTTTAMAASMVAFHAGIHVFHIESGLRTGDLSSPFPEEFNRKAIALVCSVCFPPSAIAEQKLLAEGLKMSRIHKIGNTVIDTLIYSLKNPPKSVLENNFVHLKSIVSGENDKKIVLNKTTQQLLDMDKHVVLITVHRRENFMSGAFERIGKGVLKLAQNFPWVSFIAPLHYNPEVRKTFIPLWQNAKNIHIVEPPLYPFFVQILNRISLVLTDSGGIQEEAIALHLPVLVMRTNTERIEGIWCGGSKLIGETSDKIYESTEEILLNKTKYKEMLNSCNPYGDGKATERILKTVLDFKQKKEDAIPSKLLQFTFNNLSTHFNIFNIKNNISIKNFRNSVYQHILEPNSITVILTGYKRPASQLRKQIEALKRSSIRPKEIFFFQNGNHTDFLPVLKDHPDVKHIFNRNFNSKFHSRFALPLFAKTEYVAIADDEPICGEKWLEYAIKHVSKLRAIVGSSGRRVLPSIVNGQDKYQSIHNSKLGSGYTEVDFVGHWWIWKTEWTHKMWSLPSYNLWTGEDIEFSAKLKILLRLKSITLNYPSEIFNPEIAHESSGLETLKNVASYLVPGTVNERISIIQYWISQGWNPIFTN